MALCNLRLIINPPIDPVKFKYNHFPFKKLGESVVANKISEKTNDAILPKNYELNNDQFLTEIPRSNPNNIKPNEQQISNFLVQTNSITSSTNSANNSSLSSPKESSNEKLATNLNAFNAVNFKEGIDSKSKIASVNVSNVNKSHPNLSSSENKIKNMILPKK